MLNNELILIKPTRHKDERGFFSETYSRRRYKKIGVNVDFLQDNPSTREFQDYMNDKVMSQVKLNADRILREVQETKELYDLMLQATERPLSEEERIKVREQLTDIAKSIPALAIFALPGGGILLPILIKVLPFNILPSAFSDDPPEA